jgi:hypothetical protein
MNAATVASFNPAGKAEPLKHRLEEVGIPAEIHDESLMKRLSLGAPQPDTSSSRGSENNAQPRSKTGIKPGEGFSE